MSATLKINTKGTCLFCLSTTNCRLLEGEEANNDQSSSANALKILLRYLEVDVRNMPHVPLSLKSCNGECVNLSVLMCEDCSSATSDFLELNGQMEVIRMQIDVCLRQLHAFMEDGSNDAARLMEYIYRSPGENSDLSSSSFADDMRKKIVEKFRQKLKLSLPRVVMGKPIRVVNTGIYNHSSSTTLQVEDGNEVVVPLQEIPSCLSSSLAVAVYQPQLEYPSQNQSAVPNSSNDVNQSGEPTPLPLEQEQFQISLSKCIYCEKWFSQKNLQGHQFEKHAMALLSAQGSLPSDISELDLERALSHMAQPMTSRVSKCPFCKMRGFQLQANKVRQHFLQEHRLEVISRATSVSKEQREALSGNQQPADTSDREYNQINSFASNPKPSLKIKSSCKCNYCEKYVTRSSLSRHTYRMHFMQLYKDKIPESVTKENMESALGKIVGEYKANSGVAVQCSFCPQRVSDLKLHLLRDHINEIIREAENGVSSTSSQLPCSGERRKSQRVRAPTSSQVTAQTSSKHKCNICGKQMPTKLSLKLHWAKQHLKPQHKRYPCEHCQERFTQTKHLRDHKIRFHPIAYFSDQTPKGFLAGFTDKNFDTALKEIGRRGKVNAIPTNSSQSSARKNGSLDCPFCKKRYKRTNVFRKHVSLSHLNDVVKVMNQMFYLRNG